MAHRPELLRSGHQLVGADRAEDPAGVVEALGVVDVGALGPLQVHEVAQGPFAEGQQGELDAVRVADHAPGETGPAHLGR